MTADESSHETHQEDLAYAIFTFIIGLGGLLAAIHPATAPFFDSLGYVTGAAGVALMILSLHQVSVHWGATQDV